MAGIGLQIHPLEIRRHRPVTPRLRLQNDQGPADRDRAAAGSGSSRADFEKGGAMADFGADPAEGPGRARPDDGVGVPGFQPADQGGTASATPASPGSGRRCGAAPTASTGPGPSP